MKCIKYLSDFDWHTPGPWIVDPRIAQVVDSDGIPVCAMLWPTKTGVSVDNEEALGTSSRGMDAQVFFDDFPYWVPVAELYKEIAP